MFDPTMPSIHNPKANFPGESYRSERHTLYDYNFLTPTPEALEAAAFAFAAACEEARQIVHVETWYPSLRRGLMSCPQGNRSVFHQRLHMRFARLHNRRIDNYGNALWKPGEVIDPPVSDGHSPTLRAATTPSPTIEPELLQQLLGPVSAGFADNRAHYGGFGVDHRDWGTARLIRRPDFASKRHPADAVLLSLPTLDWLDQVLAVEDTESSPALLALCGERGSLTPAQARYLDDAIAEVTELRRQRPDLPDDHPMFWSPFISSEKLNEARNHYARLLADAEARLRARRRKSGPRVLGTARLANIDPWSFRGQERTAQLEYGVCEPAAPRTSPPDRPTREESDGREPPKFVGPSHWVKRMLEAAKNFVARHRESLNAWRNGQDYAVSFPYGTIRQRLHANAVIRGGP